MPKRVPREQDKPFDGSPESWHEDDKNTMAAVDAWVADGHPAKCEDRFEGLLGRDGLRFLTVRARLLAHNIAEHGAGMEELRRAIEAEFIYDPQAVGLSKAIKDNGKRLVDEALARLTDLGSTRSGQWAISILDRSIEGAEFTRIWAATFEQDTWKTNPELANEVLANALSIAETKAAAVAFVKDHLA